MSAYSIPYLYLEDLLLTLYLFPWFYFSINIYLLIIIHCFAFYAKTIQLLFFKAAVRV